MRGIFGFGGETSPTGGQAGRRGALPTSDARCGRQAGADLEARAGGGATALHHAARYGLGDMDVAASLVQARDSEGGDQSPQTPISIFPCDTNELQALL